MPGHQHVIIIACTIDNFDTFMVCIHHVKILRFCHVINFLSFFLYVFYICTSAGV